MKTNTIKNFLIFLKKPNYESFNLSLNQKFKVLLKLYLITLVLMLSIRLLIELLIFLGAFEGYSQKISNLPEVTSKNNAYIFLTIAMVFGPAFEEIMFRLLLTEYNKKFIAVSLSLLTGYILTRSFSDYLLNIESAYIYGIMSYAYPICFALPLFAIVNSIRFEFELTWKKYYPVIFYFITIIFALTHIPTLAIHKEHHLFLPILILPFIVLGISLGYIRAKLGVLYAITFHFIFNTPMIIKILIRISGS